MYPDSPYAIPIGSFRYPVPLPTVDPSAAPVKYIPINCEWYPYIIGSLKQLLLQATWDTTDPVALNLVQMRVFTLMALFNCDTALTLDDILRQKGMEVEDTMPLRVDCDCNVFVTCCDGTEKQILTAQQVQDAINGQPGAGSPLPPPGGGCQQYHASLPGNGQWLLPPVVNTGDTIDVTGATGVSYDPDNLDWHCPGGDVFFAGLCTGVTFTNAGNPMPSVPEMKLIAKIGSTYYDVFTGSTFTVPGGVSNQQVTFLLNTRSMSGAAGNLQFDVQVCNNQALSWTSTFDLATSPYIGLIAITFGNWLSGTGVEGVAGPGGQQNTVVLDISVATTITSQTMYYNAAGSAAPSNNAQLATSSGLYGGTTTTQVGTAIPLFHTEQQTVTSLEVAVGSGNDPGPVQITKWVITGIGTRPSGWPLS